MAAGLLLYLIALIIGAAFGALRRVPNQRRTRAVVEDYEDRYGDHDRRVTYTGRVAYVVGGKKYTVTTRYQSTAFKTGKRVVVCYSADDPGKSFVRASPMIYVCMLGCALAGTVLLGKWIFALLT